MTGRIEVLNVNHKPEHQAYFIFTDSKSNLFYIVSEHAYDAFRDTESPSERARLSDIVISGFDRKVNKSRFF